MSQEKVLEILVKIGLRRPEAKVYVFLAKRGATKARDAAKALKMSKQRLYLIIKSLQRKGIVNATLEYPARFSAVPFENVLDFFVKAKIEQAQLIKQGKAGILSDWRSIATVSESPPAKFTVIEGRAHIYAKIQQMAQNAKEYLSFVVTVPGLARANQFGLFDTTLDHPSKPKIQVRFVTELHGQNMNAVKTLLNRIPKRGFNLIGKTPDLGLKLCPRMVIRDGEETVFFIEQQESEFAGEQDDVCLWTDCRSLVQAFLAMFDDLWHNSTDIGKKIAEIESEKPATKTCVIRDAEAAKKKCDEILNEAAKEILMITSSTGLIDFWRNEYFAKECAERDVSVRIMAPIMSENFEAAQQLLKSFEVRHVTPGYLGTLIVDGRHLFQFRNPLQDQVNPEKMTYYENAFYTNDFEYVEKAKNMLEDIWEKAHIPSAVTMESIIRSAASASVPSGVRKLDVAKTISEIKYFNMVRDEEASKTLTEKGVLFKAISSKKVAAKDLFKEHSRMFCTWGWTVIDSPEPFNLPKMMISALDIEEQSSLGAEDVLLVSSWLKTPSGYGYVPVAVVHNRPEAALFWRGSNLGMPAEQNILTVKKDELQVRVHGNTLFAGWTVPIKFLSGSFCIPPACLLFEGFGVAKPGRFTMITPARVTNKLEYNSLEAFVSFIHPSSKYEAPATEGILLRDCIIEIHPM
jgi:sugar-specific transcriptional regulator TrmB